MDCQHDRAVCGLWLEPGWKPAAAAGHDLLLSVLHDQLWHDAGSGDSEPGGRDSGDATRRISDFILLSGYIFPVDNIPQPLRSLSYIVPMRYYLEVIRDAFLRGGGWAAVWPAPIALALLGGFFFWRGWSVMKDMQVKA